MSLPSVIRPLIGVAGFIVIAVVLWEAFEAVVLPRRVTRRFRLTRLFYRFSWRPWSAIARHMHSGKLRETYLSFYGPLSLLLLFGLWAMGLIVGFALLEWALALPLRVQQDPIVFSTYLYLSGTTFFTLGLGDVVPLESLGRSIVVLESGLGFGYLALVIGYLPVLFQASSRREMNVSLLDARAGSPPTAAELLRRQNHECGGEALRQLFHDWERWCAELLESHLSYPVLAYFRSQHDNQSWLAALTAILDSSALVITGITGAPAQQARLTFATARHTVVDLAQILKTPPRPPASDRLPAAELDRLRQTLATEGLRLRDDGAAEQKLRELRQMYEPYIGALSNYLSMPLPPWIPVKAARDNWQTSAWERSSRAHF